MPEKITVPELLAPAGDLERLKIAVLYGADAVYIGGELYGLRAKAKNFSMSQMAEGIEFAHKRGVKIYITANIFAHNADLDGMSEYFKEIEKIGADALIISDPGVFSLARKAVPDMEIHISTQANNTNYLSASFWHGLGAKRIVAARELSMPELTETRRMMPDGMDIEAFVHGAMCISYSGRCLLSNYMTERDANRGECSHPCRWKYNLVEETRPGEYMPVFEDERGTYIYNSKDLCMIHHIPELINAGVSSFKIEGRMKTPFYVGTVVKAYREAIDDFLKSPLVYESKKEYYIAEVSKASHREFTTGFYFGKPSGKEQIYTNSSYIRDYDFIGMVCEDYDEASKTALVMQRNKFESGDEIEVMPSKGPCFPMTVKKMQNEDGEEIFSAPHPQQLIRMEFDRPVRKFDMLRKKSSSPGSSEEA